MSKERIMQRTFRKYHRVLATIVFLPIALTVLTGMLATLIREWSLPLGLTPNFLIRIHTGEIFHLEAVYPLLNGLGLIGLLVTGITMLQSRRKVQKSVKNVES